MPEGENMKKFEGCSQALRSAKLFKVARSAAVLLTAVLTASAAQSQVSISVNFDSSVPAKTREQLLNDLEFIKTVQGTKISPLHRQVFGEMTGANYYSYFDSRVKSVAFDASMSGGAVAYVSPFIDSTQMVLTKNFTQFDHPQIARLMVVFHEARHTERQSGFWMHAVCPVPFKDANGNDIKSIWTGMPLAGEDGCDDHAVGAYGSTVVMLKNIETQCESCTEKVKMDAALYGNDQMNRVTNRSARDQIEKDLNALL
jgi:hypothetical protein